MPKFNPILSVCDTGAGPKCIDLLPTMLELGAPSNIPKLKLVFKPRNPGKQGLDLATRCLEFKVCGDSRGADVTRIRR